MDTVAILKTGGTIDSKAVNSIRKINTEQSKINKTVEHSSVNVDVEIFEVCNKLSENMTPIDWITISKSIQHKIENGFDKIIVTHGTDTMFYSASVSEILFGNESCKIIFTGAMRGVDEENSDVDLSITSSLKAISNDGLKNGVYINMVSEKSFCISNMYQATKVIPPNMDSKGYTSLFGESVGTYENRGWVWEDYEYDRKLAKNEFDIPNKHGIEDNQNKISFRNIYPSIQFTFHKDTKIVILNAYHSGTASISNYKNSLVEKVKSDKTITFFLCGFSTKLISEPYDSTNLLMNEGINLIKDIQPHVAYVYLYIELAQQTDHSNFNSNLSVM